MDVSLESKILPSVGYSRKSYLQVTSQRLARDKLVNLHGRRSLALPSVGPSLRFRRCTKRAAKSLRSKRLISQRVAKLAFSLRCSASNVSQISGNFRRNSTALCKMAAKSFRNKRVISQPCIILPSAWSDWLPMAVTPSFQLRIRHCLKHWTLEFLSFEMSLPTIISHDHLPRSRHRITYHDLATTHRIFPLFSFSNILFLDPKFVIKKNKSKSTSLFALAT
ncbi:hypothetical protein AAG906_006564 [Vitis piasezkii]